MTTEEKRKRLAKNHETLEDIARASVVLAGDERALARFNAAVSEKSLAKKSADRTATARKARQRERDRAFEVGEVEDPSRRAACRYDLVKFGMTYCASMLNHAPSDERYAASKKRTPAMRSYAKKLWHENRKGRWE